MSVWSDGGIVDQNIQVIELTLEGISETNDAGLQSQINLLQNECGWIRRLQFFGEFINQLFAFVEVLNR